MHHRHRKRQQARLEYCPQIADIVATETSMQFTHQQRADNMHLNRKAARRCAASCRPTQGLDCGPEHQTITLYGLGKFPKNLACPSFTTSAGLYHASANADTLPR